MTAVTAALAPHLDRWRIVAYSWPLTFDPVSTVYLRKVDNPAQTVRGTGNTLAEAMNSAARRIDMRA